MTAFYLLPLTLQPSPFIRGPCYFPFAGNASSSLRLSSRTFTRGSPRKPKSATFVFWLISPSTWRRSMPRALATRGACASAEAGLMSGSSPLACCHQDGVGPLIGQGSLDAETQTSTQCYSESVDSECSFLRDSCERLARRGLNRNGRRGDGAKARPGFKADTG
jgi:hypothetical protein